MKINLLLSLCVIGLLIILFLDENCEEQLILTANVDIHAYSDTVNKNVSFKISPRTTCATGKIVTGKVFSYRKVLCHIGGKIKSGYIIAEAGKSYTISSEEFFMNY